MSLITGWFPSASCEQGSFCIWGGYLQSWKPEVVDGNYLMRNVGHEVENHFCWSIKEMNRHLERPGGKKPSLSFWPICSFLKICWPRPSADSIHRYFYSSQDFSISVLFTFEIKLYCWGLSHVLQIFSSILGLCLLNLCATYPSPQIWSHKYL